jgi:hypothetical protein
MGNATAEVRSRKEQCKCCAVICSGRGSIACAWLKTGLVMRKSGLHPLGCYRI